MSEDTLVTPLYEREPDSVPGPFYVVKDQCIICGLPPETAPQNITWDAETQRTSNFKCPRHCRVERQPETAEEIEQMIEAVRGSCVQAIRYCGTNPTILARLRECGEASACDALCRRHWWQFWKRS